jgi:hypothetical protein
MPYLFEATDDYFYSERKINTLIDFAIKESAEGNDENRLLFLKLGVVFLVTRFQVYIENVLDEFNFKLGTSEKRHRELPLHLRLTTIKIQNESISVQRQLENPDNYNEGKLLEIKNQIDLLNHLCNDDHLVDRESKIKSQFPLGRQGLNDLKYLFKQIEGIDIFENKGFDINKLNEILNIRHNIVHEDANPQLTEITLRDYKIFISTVVEYIDNYLGHFFI